MWGRWRGLREALPLALLFLAAAIILGLDRLGASAQLGQCLPLGGDDLLGTVGGPIGALAPLISTVLGVKTVPITFTKDGLQRRVEIPGIMRVGVHAAPSMNPDGAIMASNAHPFNMEALALAVGDEGNRWEDYGMRWDNSGKNGHYAAIRWSGN